MKWDNCRESVEQHAMKMCDQDLCEEVQGQIDQRSHNIKYPAGKPFGIHLPDGDMCYCCSCESAVSLSAPGADHDAAPDAAAEVAAWSGTALTLLPELRGIDDWEELRRRVGEALGVEDSIPEPALRRAVLDHNFARYLLVSRSDPAMMHRLLHAPRNEAFADAVVDDILPIPALRDAVDTDQAETAPDKTHSTRQLVTRAASSWAKWARAGFTRVSTDELEQRLSACASCPHLQAKPDTVLYKLTIRNRDDYMCGECGCPVGSKAQRATEACPSEDPSNPGCSRWGDAMPAAFAATERI